MDALLRRHYMMTRLRPASQQVISYRATPSGSGTASIAKIKGRTDAWQQVLNPAIAVAFGGASISPLTGGTSWSVTAAGSGSGMQIEFFTAPGHKIAIFAAIKTNEAVSIRLGLYHGGNTTEETINGRAVLSGILTTATAANDDRARIDVRGGYTGTFNVEGFVAYDLTLQYGAGREPATVAAFLAEYPEALIAPYNAGKLVPNKVTALVTDGFNQWDEQWEVGGIYSSNGANNNSVTNRIRSKNYCRCFPNTIYYGKNNDIDSVAIFWYDVNKTYISYTTFAAGGGLSTSPNGAYYFRISPNQTYTTYNHDIAINLSHSGIRNGEYEPHWTSTLNIVHSQIYGKLNGAGEMVQIAPNGFRGVGSNYDEVDVARKEAYIRRAWVDMGTLNWTYQANVMGGSNAKSGFYASVIGFKNYSGNELPLGLCVKYPASSPNALYSGADKAFTIFNNNLFIADSSAGYDHAAFKTAMDGVMLDFQLATPLHYTDLMYSEDGGQTFIEIPSNYRVDDFGTERRLPDGIVDGAPASTPLVADIRYPW